MFPKIDVAFAIDHRKSESSSTVGTFSCAEDCESSNIETIVSMLIKLLIISRIYPTRYLKFALYFFRSLQRRDVNDGTRSTPLPLHAREFSNYLFYDSPSFPNKEIAYKSLYLYSHFVNRTPEGFHFTPVSREKFGGAVKISYRSSRRIKSWRFLMYYFFLQSCATFSIEKKKQQN